MPNRRQLRPGIPWWLQTDTRMGEFMLGILALGWGVWLTFFQVMAASSVFRVMLSISNQSSWAFIFFIVGLTRLAGLYYNRLDVRFGASLASTILWVFAWCSYLVSNYQSITIVTQGVIMLASIAIQVTLTLQYTRPGGDR